MYEVRVKFTLIYEYVYHRIYAEYIGIKYIQLYMHYARLTTQSIIRPLCRLENLKKNTDERRLHEYWKLIITNLVAAVCVLTEFQDNKTSKIIRL